MEDIGDDFFSDDDFESLPLGTLLQLEQNAYGATQAPHVLPEATSSQNVSSTDWPNLSVSYNTKLKPLQLRDIANEYGALDVGELDAQVSNDPAGQTPTLDLRQFTGQQANKQTYDVHLDQNLPAAGDGHTQEMEIKGSDIPQHIYEDFSLRVRNLMLENERINRELAAAKSMIDTKSGEISIIRANHARITENYDCQLAALRKAMLDSAEKHEGEVEAVRAERKMLATENAFLKQDLTEEAIRSNNLKSKGKMDENVDPVTPRKAKVLPFRDGFDDDEVIAVSPTKSTATRSRGPSSLVTGKRKRATSQNSPTPLQLSPQVERMVEDSGSLDGRAAGMGYTEGKDQNLQFLKRIMNHRMYPNGQRDIEVMAKLAFPSEPQLMLSTIVLQETADRDSGNYVMDYMFSIISIWSRALNEKFFIPIPVFMGITRFILTFDLSSDAQDLIEHLVPVLQESGDINGIPRFKYWRQHLGQIRQTPLSELQLEVDGTEALSLLYSLAVKCLHIDEAIESFWRNIRYDFILMMLNCSQPLQDIVMALNLLAMGIRADSFGPILETGQDRTISEHYIIDRVTNLLSDVPRLDEGQEPYDPLEVCSMRLEALSFLVSIAFSPVAPSSSHGSLLIASHPTVLARLVRAMHDEMDALYLNRPEQGLHSAMINGLMRLIYGVVRRHPDSVDLQAQLGRVPGGKQKFIVVLTRLAFSEGPVLESDIEDETVEMAHEMLDDAVNPQEAEALLDAFPSARRDDL